jgi:hypothetical protein
VNEKALAHWGMLCQKQTKTMLKHELGAVYYGIFQMLLYFPLLFKNTSEHIQGEFSG